MKVQNNSQNRPKGNLKHYTFNKIRVLTISDPNALKSSCSFSINVGSKHQPEQIPGLAHLLEHMLFLGSDEYRQNNSLSQYIASHAGYQNAQTQNYFTNYYFDIFDEYFQQALKRKCDSFIYPLFPQQYIQAQIQAIHEQFILSCADNESRLQQIHKLFQNKPLDKFTIGNNTTLNLSIKQIRQKLIQFYDQFYRNAQINIVLYSKMVIQEMEGKLVGYIIEICDRFGNNEANIENIEQMFGFQGYCREKINKFVQVKSILNQDTLYIQFIINLSNNNEICQKFTNQPDRLQFLQSLTLFTHQFQSVLNYIICHPSDKSLQTYLDNYDFTTDCTVSFQQIVPFTQFMIRIQLDIDQQDLNKISIIYQKVSQYLHKILNIQNFIKSFRQISYNAQLKYKNHEVQDMQDYVCELARNMYQVGLKNCVSYKAMFENSLQKYRNLLKWCIQEILTRNNKLIILSSPQKLKGNIRKEPYSNSEYTLNQMLKLQKNFSLKLNPSIFIQQNTFIPLPQKLHIPENTPYIPIKLAKNIHYSHSFREILKGGIYLVVYNNQNYVYNKVFVEFMNIVIAQIQDIEFAASIGLQYYWNYQDGRLLLQLFGYDWLVLNFLQKIGKQIRQLVGKIKDGSAKNNQDIEDWFKQAIQNLTDQVDNYYEEEMDDLTEKIRDHILVQNTLPLHLIIKQAEKIKKNKFLQRLADLLDNCTFQWIVVGNFDCKQVLAVIQNFQLLLNSQNTINRIKPKIPQKKILNLSKTSLNKQKSLKFQILLKSSQIKTSTCLAYFEGGPYTQQLLWILNILSLYLQQPFYNYMRVIKNISYDLQINVINTRGILGLCMMVVSSKIDAERISKYIHQFIYQYLDYNILQKNLQRNYEQFKHMQLLKYTQHFATVQDCFNFITSQIINRSYNFTIKNMAQISTQLQQLTIQKIVKICQTIFFKTSSLQILVISKNHKDMYTTHRPKIVSLQYIKSNFQYYKDFLVDLQFSFIQEK